MWVFGWKQQSVERLVLETEVKNKEVREQLWDVSTVVAVLWDTLPLESSFWVYMTCRSAKAHLCSLGYLAKAWLCLFYHKWWFKCSIELCGECSSLLFTRSVEGLESSWAHEPLTLVSLSFGLGSWACEKVCTVLPRNLLRVGKFDIKKYKLKCK